MGTSVAVIVPVRDGMPYLPEAIASVCAQGYAELEIIVVDDGSVDGSGDFARSQTDCRVLTTPEIGPAGARNVGIRASQSELILFLDADDLAPPDSLHASLQALRQMPNAGFAQGYIRNFTSRPNGSIELVTKPYRFINLGSALWRRELIEAAGLLDESLRLGEDQDLFMRFWERDIAKAPVDAATLYYRRHAGNMTRGLKGAEFGLMRVYRKRIERIKSGEYDPSTPRHMSWPDYLGASPADGSEE